MAFLETQSLLKGLLLLLSPAYLNVAKLEQLFKGYMDNGFDRSKKIEQDFHELEDLDNLSYCFRMKLAPNEKYKELDSKLPVFYKFFFMVVPALVIPLCTIEQIAKAYNNQNRFNILEFCAIQLQIIMYSCWHESSKDVLQFGNKKGYFNFRNIVVLTANWTV